MKKKIGTILVLLMLLAIPMSVSAEIAQVRNGKILVDSSRDGGAWWFPQSYPFDQNANHQGKALADYLRSIGYEVTELPRPFTIDSVLLSKYDLVIRASEYGSYSASEIEAYKDYVANGGKLLLLSDHRKTDPEDSLALTFGLSFAGISRGKNIINQFATHPITKGVSQVYYGVGSGLTNYPSNAHILGWLSSDTYLDLNNNNIQDPNEPFGAPVFGYMSYREGRIVFLGDTNTLLDVPQPLTDNIINWLISSTTPTPTTTSTPTATPTPTTPTPTTTSSKTPQLTISQTTLKEEPEVREEAIITVSIVNTGSGTAKSIQLTESIPSSVSVSYVNGADSTGNLVTWRGELRPGETHIIQHTFRIIEEKNRFFPVIVRYEDVNGNRHETSTTIYISANMPESTTTTFPEIPLTWIIAISVVLLGIAIIIAVRRRGGEGGAEITIEENN